MGVLNKAKERMDRFERLKKRQKLRDIIEAVLSGSYYLNKEPLDDIFNLNPSRMEYVSPSDRSTYNYGYMEGKEMYGVPNE